ncbi:MAG: [protein-PII] uridylyltransferase [Intrasporangium sp.]|uniref:[protein-PII] uridylyltransferase n=1 Tax=Intrasporangium sp. TaxID=1925024 RepID=UPI00264903BB|nr:[protein-PII] uridylyltransferase [Intrasporangium sp.]MDN5797437.1 [protein-PII] uridylyltransferase [Intrasporangium sp.]
MAGSRGFVTPGAGASRRRAIAEHSRAWLEQVWDEACAGRRLDGVALAAVGSLARGDSGPRSDLDLVLLHHPRGLPASGVSAFADRLWYPIWDSGARLDHSVRTVAECRAVAVADLTAAVSLLDITCVAGDPDVVAAARSTVAHDWRASARKRLPEVQEAVTARYARHGDLAHLVEPDLKEARGGLRDMALLRALAAAWLTDRPHGDVDTAYGRLLDVRDAIHVVTGRDRDRLGREDQDACAALLGHPDADALLTEVSSAARVIAYAAQTTLRRSLQSQQARVLRVRPRRPQLTPLGYGLYRHDGEVVLGPSTAVASDPLLPLRAAVVAARNGLPLAPATLRNLAEHAPPLPEPWPQLARELFADLLAAGPGLVPVWEGLDLVGVIERWLPEWAGVRCRPQRSPVHRHTVDRHLVETAVIASGMLPDLDRPDLLVLAALLHDIGKLAGSSDHSTTGADIAADVVARMGLPDVDATLVVRLVREHLTLVELATRRDPTDPATVAVLDEAVGGSAQTLELLRILTEADARAAGPLAWTDWRAGLVDRLCARAGQVLEPSFGVAVAGPVELALASLEEHLTGQHLEQLAMGHPVVSVETLGGAHRVQVVDRDRVGLFADTAGLLGSMGFGVRSARVRTHEGLAVNEWWVDSPGGEAPVAERIGRDLVRVAAGDRGPLAKLDRRRAGSAPHHPPSGPPSRARVRELPGASDHATVLEVRAADRPDLLRHIGLALARASVTIRSAHISTRAGQALDTFYVTEFAGGLLAPARSAHAIATIIEACGGVAGAHPSNG